MRTDDPSDDDLRTADRIVLIDPQRPDWYQPLFASLLLRPNFSLEIPVDSTDSTAIQQWRERIKALNLHDSEG